jgi:hypothetical protein
MVLGDLVYLADILEDALNQFKVSDVKSRKRQSDMTKVAITVL